MYKSFRVKNFRCFDDVEIKGFKRVNLIAGLNNAGKTALLEAIWLHCGRYKPELTSSLSVFRGVERVTVQVGGAANETLWDSLFGEFDAARPLELHAKDSDNKDHVVSLRVLRTSRKTFRNFVIVHYTAKSLAQTRAR